MAKIAVIAGEAKTLVNFRGELIKEMVKRGHEVVVMVPESKESNLKYVLYSLGARFCPFFLQRTGLNPLRDLQTLFSLFRILRRESPAIVFSSTAKPVIYGSLAAQLAEVPQIYSLITGLGYAFVDDQTPKRRVLAGILKLLYKQALRKNEKVFFQNPDDLELFKAGNLLTSRQPVLINGSGVDVQKFSYVEPRVRPFSFLLAARLIWDKGIGEFVEAARMLKPRYPEVHFKLIGPFDINPAAISREKITSWMAAGAIEYLGETDDVRPYLSAASVFVLPSFYREGIPRSILEAMSMGRPVITTDAPGCREAVRHGVNGFLVPVKDPVALALAMERFILNPELVPSMGIQSRKIAVEKYDVRKINQEIMQVMGLVKENEKIF